MGYRRRLVTWSVTGFLRHLALFGAALAGALLLVGAVIVGAGSLATRIALAMADRTADREWAEALAPLSAVPERYPVTETDDRALRLEGIAASLGIRLEAGESGETTARPATVVDPLRLASAVALLLSGDPPVWAMNITDCRAAPATSDRGHRELQRLLLSTAGRAIARGEPATAREILEASWRLNEVLLRSPCLDCHLAACAIIEQEMALLGELPDPGDEWRVRLAALDLEQYILEAYRFEAWRARCLADHHFDELHPALSWIARPLARLAAHQQHEAMLFAVRELPRRDLRSFDADAFVAEQHARVSRANPIGQPSLPHDWTSWPRSMRAALSVDLALRVLELRAAATADGHETFRPQPRQPSRVAGVDWLYEAVPGGIAITIDSTGWPEMAERPLRAVVRLRPTAVRGDGA